MIAYVEYIKERGIKEYFIDEDRLFYRDCTYLYKMNKDGNTEKIRISSNSIFVENFLLLNSDSSDWVLFSDTEVIDKDGSILEDKAEKVIECRDSIQFFNCNKGYYLNKDFCISSAENTKSLESLVLSMKNEILNFRLFDKKLGYNKNKSYINIYDEYFLSNSSVNVVTDLKIGSDFIDINIDYLSRVSIEGGFFIPFVYEGNMGVIEYINGVFKVLGVVNLKEEFGCSVSDVYAEEEDCTAKESRFYIELNQEGDYNNTKSGAIYRKANGGYSIWYD